jgi:hypothetical protein
MQTNAKIFNNISMNSSYSEKYFRRICVQSQNIYFYLITFSFENLALCEIPWRNIVEPDRPQMIFRMRVACRISEATNTH